jgi:hypothetical protein
MAKTTAPLLSFGASGQVAKSQVYAKWKGRPYVRRHVIPANPQSTAQTYTRDMFNWLSQVWKLMPGNTAAAWTLFASGQVLTNRNAFVGKNVQAMRNKGGVPDTDLANFIFQPGAKGGISAAGATFTGAAGQITIAVTQPTSVPTGWTISQAIGAVIPQQAPTSGTLYQMVEGTDVSPPYSIVITGLAAGNYQCAAFLEWIKPDASVAYSASITGTATVT